MQKIVVDNHKIDGNLDTNFLKLIAIIAMLTDHIGKIFLPEIIILQIVGRIAFPIFAYCIVVGCLYTSNMKKYILRLALFGVISQPLYVLAFDTEWTVVNIFLFLVLGVLVIYTLKEKLWVVFTGLVLLSGFFNIGYGIRGVLLMIVFYIYRKKPKTSMILSSAVLLLPTINDIVFSDPEFSIQGFSFLSIPLIYSNVATNIKINKYFFYVFYPLHLLILYIVRISI